MASRFVVVASAVLGIACSRTPPEPVVHQVTPSVVGAREGGTLLVTGDHFHPRPTVSFDDESASHVDSRFLLRLDGTGQHLELAEVQRLSQAQLSASLPPGALPPGVYDLTLEDAYGRTVTLAEALTVVGVVRGCRNNRDCTTPDYCHNRGVCRDQVCVFTASNNDSDGDGHIDDDCGGTDCDDEPKSCGAGCFPGNPAVQCDQFDHDCDGQIEEGATTWYIDADGDGHGGATGELASCSPPPGQVARGGDCDDSTPLVTSLGPCDDGNACTAFDTCVRGRCAGHDQCRTMCEPSCDSCGAGQCCADSCPGGQCGRCTEGCDCDLTCTGAEQCRARCERGTRCHVVVKGSRDAEMLCEEAACQFECVGSGCAARCLSGSACTLSCLQSSCTLDCEDGASCLLTCDTPAACQHQCSAPVSCSTGVIACNAPCPPA